LNFFLGADAEEVRFDDDEEAEEPPLPAETESLAPDADRKSNLTLDITFLPEGDLVMGCGGGISPATVALTDDEDEEEGALLLLGLVEMTLFARMEEDEGEEEGEEEVGELADLDLSFPS
jgi:hypothetical protein